MNSQVRNRLWFGPYKTPIVRPGQMLLCAVRGRVSVDAISKAPIPWPLNCDSRPVFIVCGDLLRALGQESIQAISHHWAVGYTTVSGWRRRIGITGRNPGTKRLMRAWLPEKMMPINRLALLLSGKPAVIRAHAEKLLVKPLPATMRKLVRLLAIHPKSKRARQRLLQYAKRHRWQNPEYRYRVWTPAEDKLLGTKTDLEVGKQIGRSEKAVQGRRRFLKIPSVYSLKGIEPWTQAEKAAVGTAPDITIAHKLGRTKEAVTQMRQALGRIAIRPDGQRPWTAAELELLGTMSDQRLARGIGRTPAAVQAQRSRLGIRLG